MSAPEALPPEVMERIKGVFFQDCDDLLAELETGLLALQNGERDPEIVNTVFRAVHSVKGGAGFFGCKAVEELAHAMENLLDHARQQDREMDAAAIDALLAGADRITALLDDVEHSNDADVSGELG